MQKFNFTFGSPPGPNFLYRLSRISRATEFPLNCMIVSSALAGHGQNFRLGWKRGDKISIAHGRPALEIRPWSPGIATYIKLERFSTINRFWVPFTKTAFLLYIYDWKFLEKTFCTEKLDCIIFFLLDQDFLVTDISSFHAAEIYDVVKQSQAMLFCFDTFFLLGICSLLSFCKSGQA